MPTLVILATADTGLAYAWERQMPPGRTVLRLSPQTFPGGTVPGFAALVVLDAAVESSLPPSLARCPTIYVGEPRSLPFEQAKMAGRAKVYLSYEDSATRLRELLPLVEELAEKQSVVDLLTDKNRRVEPVRPIVRTVSREDAELWDFVEGAVENLDSRDRIIAEFRRASRHLLRASSAVFFLRDGDWYRADRGTSCFPADDPLVAFFEAQPTVIDGTNWDSPADPVAELAVRNRLAVWGSRLLVPIHESGRLLGLIALGVREDGQPFDDADRARAVMFARLLRQILAKSAQLARLTHIADQASLGAKYLPGTLVLGLDEHPPRHVPLVVRDLIGQARQSREIRRVAPTMTQPFRASAGIIAETGGVWAFWEEARGEVSDGRAQQATSRRTILREIALTLSHELGNSLVSLGMFRQVSAAQPLPDSLLATIKGDVAKLETLNRHIGLMQTLHEISAETADVREIAQAVGAALGLRVDVGPDPVVLHVARSFLEFALRAFVETVIENRGALGVQDLALKVRSTGAGEECVALLSLKGKQLELEGILPEPAEGAIPNQGHLSVFIAREILRLHHGEIHAGPGMEGTEILISLRSF